MKLYNLKRVSEYDVKDWLHKNIPNLTAYQKEKIDSEFVRMSPFTWYKKAGKQKSSIWWRLTIILFLPYLLILYIGLPLTFIVRGSWGYGSKFYEGFHSYWMRKLNMNL